LLLYHGGLNSRTSRGGKAWPLLGIMQVALLWQEPLDLLHSTALFVICISLMRLNTAISYMAIQETYYHLLPNILTSSFYNLSLAAGVNTSFIIRILTCVHLLRIYRVNHWTTENSYLDGITSTIVFEILHEYWPSGHVEPS
jgi:hypothetical protein